VGFVCEVGRCCHYYQHFIYRLDDSCCQLSPSSKIKGFSMRNIMPQSAQRFSRRKDSYSSKAVTLASEVDTRHFSAGEVSAQLGILLFQIEEKLPRNPCGRTVSM
jgi:hypothetical protein